MLDVLKTGLRPKIYYLVYNYWLESIPIMFWDFIQWKVDHTDLSGHRHIQKDHILYDQQQLGVWMSIEFLQSCTLSLQMLCWAWDDAVGWCCAPNFTNICICTEKWEICFLNNMLLLLLLSSIHKPCQLLAYLVVPLIISSDGPASLFVKWYENESKEIISTNSWKKFSKRSILLK